MPLDLARSLIKPGPVIDNLRQQRRAAAMLRLRAAAQDDATYNDAASNAYETGDGDWRIEQSEDGFYIYDANDVEQFSVRDGAAWAGGGAVKLDENGIAIITQSDGSEPDSQIIKYTLSDGTILSRLVATYAETAGLSSTNQLHLRAKELTEGIDTARVRITAIDDSGTTQAEVYVESADNDGTVAITADHITMTGLLSLPSSGNLTISGGAITITGSRHKVDTEGGAATDDLDTINGGSDKGLLILSTVNNSRDVTLKDGTGNLQLAGDCTLFNARDRIILEFDSVLAVWCEITRSIN